MTTQNTTLAEDLHAALCAGEIRAVYQPVCSSYSRDIIGCEVLARWTHPTRGVVPPDVFIPAAAGFATLFDAAMFGHAAEQLTAWGESGPERVSVNATPESLSDPGFVDLIDATVRAHGHTLERFCIEINERERLDADCIVSLNRFRALGAHLSLDDLGTGYAALWLVNQIEIDELKIDKMFIANLESDYTCRVIVRGLVSMADELDLHIVAEGVESEEVAEILSGLGVTRLQGFHLGRPGPGDDLVFVSRLQAPAEFQPAGTAPQEAERQAALDAYRILDTEPEKEFDRLVQIAAQVCGASKAMVSFIDGNRLWIKSSLGFEGIESPRTTSFCDHAVYDHEVGACDPATHGVLVVDDSRIHPRFSGNPHTTGALGVRMYAGAPLVSATGHAIGTLCVFDSVPKRLNDSQISLLAALAVQVVAHLELRVVTADLAAVVESRAAAQAALQHEATHDHLTGLANRRLFFSTLRELADAGSPFGVVFVDLDGFKQVNDAFGHAAGDEHLRWCAATLTRTVRPGDIVARVGGDEFAVIVPGASADLDTIAHRVRAALNRTIRTGADNIVVGGSVGVSTFCAGGDLQQLLHEADCQMYGEKERGKAAQAAHDSSG